MLRSDCMSMMEESNEEQHTRTDRDGGHRRRAGGRGTGFAGPTGVARNVAYGLNDGTFSGRREYAYYGFVRSRRW